MMTMSMCLTLIKSPKHMQTRRHKRQSTTAHNIHQPVFNDNTTNTYTVQYNTTIKHVKLTYAFHILTTAGNSAFQSVLNAILNLFSFFFSLSPLSSSNIKSIVCAEHSD